MDFEKNKRYFEVTSYKWPIIILVVGIILVFLKVMAIGLIAIGLGALLIYLKLSKKVSDEEIDKAYEAGLARVKEKALSKLGIDEEQVSLIEPIRIEGLAFENVRSTPWRVKKGKDDKIRTSSYKAIFLFFSEQQLYCYSYIFSIIADEWKEETDEYFYKDVVSVSTSSLNEEYTDSSKVKWTYNGESFRLTTSGGTSISALVRNEEDASQKIMAMKQLLREKKSS